MLDAVELSHHTSLTDLREEPRLGRRTWWARAPAPLAPMGDSSESLGHRMEILAVDAADALPPRRP